MGESCVAVLEGGNFVSGKVSGKEKKKKRVHIYEEEVGDSWVGWLYALELSIWTESYSAHLAIPKGGKPEGELEEEKTHGDLMVPGSLCSYSRLHCFLVSAVLAPQP